MQRRTKFYVIVCFGFVGSLILFRGLSCGPNIEQILHITRTRIKHDLRNYNFTHSGVDKLEDLVMESGGNPLRSVIITSWRSGSSFLGDLLNANPGSFYNYEPFFNYDKKQIRGNTEEEEAVIVLKNLLRCNFSDRDDYFQLLRRHRSFFYRNKRFSEACSLKGDLSLCYDADFTAQLCRLFPFQITKTVRVRLRLADNFLQETELAARVVFLIRDPRAVIHSRLRKMLCHKSDCIDPGVVCADMVNDYEAAGRLIQKYPERVRVLRFEDLALNLSGTTLELMKFLRFDYTTSVKKFIASHSNIRRGGPYSTFRVTKNVPYQWKKDMEFDRVLKIQEACKKAMNLWGYQLAHNASHMSSEDFDPLETYSVFRDII